MSDDSQATVELKRFHTGDAIRYFILNTHGGLYLDMDVECFQSTRTFLRDYTLVLNGEAPEGHIVTNAAMASAPGLPIWQCVFNILKVGQACDSHHPGDLRS